MFPFIFLVNVVRTVNYKVTHGVVIPDQLAERAVFQMKQQSVGGSWASSPVSSWQLEEAQVFWAKGEQGLALGLLRQMINNLEEKVRHRHAGSWIFLVVLKTLLSN